MSLLHVAFTPVHADSVSPVQATQHAFEELANAIAQGKVTRTPTPTPTFTLTPTVAPTGTPHPTATPTGTPMPTATPEPCWVTDTDTGEIVFVPNDDETAYVPIPCPPEDLEVVIEPSETPTAVPSVTPTVEAVPQPSVIYITLPAPPVPTAQVVYIQVPASPESEPVATSTPTAFLTPTQTDTPAPTATVTIAPTLTATSTPMPAPVARVPQPVAPVVPFATLPVAAPKPRPYAPPFQALLASPDDPARAADVSKPYESLEEA